jgi:broad specificity phosphatase PhoE
LTQVNPGLHWDFLYRIGLKAGDELMACALAGDLRVARLIPAKGLPPALALAVVFTTTPLAAQASAVVIVRHAEKQAESGDPALTEAGMARAQALRTTLAEFPLQGIFVSEYRRTLLTAAPTAEAFHLTPTSIPIHGDKTAQAAATAQAIRLMEPGSAALIVGHSNTVGLLIAALGGPAVPELCDGENATIFVLELPDSLPPRLLRASYGTPDPPAALTCHGG